MFGQVTATGLTATFLLHLRRVFCLLWKNTAPRWTFLVALPSPWPLYVLSFVSRGIPVTTKAWAPPPPYHWSRKRKAVKKDGPSFQSTSKQSSARHVCSVSLLVQIKMLLSKNWWHCTGTKKNRFRYPSLVADDGVNLTLELAVSAMNSSCVCSVSVSVCHL